jgi:hypothetical protein
MVHALEITHGLLKAGGLLIDIHPIGEPALIEVHVGGEVRVAGHLEETGNFVEYLQADDALADVTSRGLFRLEREGQFTYLTHASTIKALVDFIEAEWSDSMVREETIKRAEELMGEPGENREIVLREIGRIARFRADRK